MTIAVQIELLESNDEQGLFIDFSGSLLSVAFFM